MKLLDLPAEDRCRIWGFLDHNVEIDICHFQTQNSTWESHYRRQHPPGHPAHRANETHRVSTVPPALLVNKQMHREVSATLPKRRVILNFCQLRDLTAWDRTATEKQKQALLRISACVEVNMPWPVFLKCTLEHVAKALVEEMARFAGPQQSLRVLPVASALDQENRRFVMNFSVGHQDPLSQRECHLFALEKSGRLALEQSLGLLY